MPARYHPVSPTVWDRGMRHASTEAKLVRLYLLTCPGRHSEGLFQLPVGIIAHDTGLTAEQVSEAMVELEALGFTSYDTDAEVVLDRTALAFTPLRNGLGKDGTVKPDRRIEGAVRFLEACPPTDLKADFLELARVYSPDLFVALCERFGGLDAQPHRLSASPSEGASQRSQGASPETEAPRRAEPRGEGRGAGVSPSGVALPSNSACDECGIVLADLPPGDFDPDQFGDVCRKCFYAHVPF